MQERKYKFYLTIIYKSLKGSNRQFVIQLNLTVQPRDTSLTSITKVDIDIVYNVN